jgi:uncharacterized delta-60 repeat protein
MSFSSWIRRVLARPSTRGHSRVSPPCSPRRRQCARLALEALEDRCLLAAGALGTVAGALDSSFNPLAVSPLAPGKQAFSVLSPLDSSVSHAVAVQADGKIILAGVFIYHGGGSDFAVARLNVNGTLDTTFGTGGTTIIHFGEHDDASAVALQSDGKIVVAGSTDTAGNIDFAVARLNSDGSLDNSFSGDGKQNVDFDLGGDFDDEANGVAIQPDGKIVLAGFASFSNDTDFAFARLNADGTPDGSFSGDGKQTVGFDLGDAFDEEDDVAGGVALQSDGKIVAAGGAETAAGSVFAIVRLNSDGTPDNSFNGNGKQTVDIGSRGSARARAVAIQTDGKIVAAGSTDFISAEFAVARLKTDGTLDNSFNGNGKQTIPFGFGASASGVVIQPGDGKIIVAGGGNETGDGDFAVARLNSDGLLDSSFANAGKQTVAIGPGVNLAMGAALSPNGRIVLGGGLSRPPARPSSRWPGCGGSTRSPPPGCSTRRPTPSPRRTTSPPGHRTGRSR